MKLYDYLRLTECDYDTYDDAYDAVITVCINTEPEDDYDEFCIDLCNKIDICKISEDGNPICNWSEFIERNLHVFRKFANKYWTKGNYEDEEDFIYEWIKELHMFLAGYGNDYTFYKEELLDKCK